MSSPFWAAEHWCQEENSKVRHSFELVVLVCALLMLPALLIQDSGLHSPWSLVSWILGTVAWLIFTVELALTLRYAQDRRRRSARTGRTRSSSSRSSRSGGCSSRRSARAGCAAGVSRASGSSPPGSSAPRGLLTQRRNLPYIAALTLLLVTVTGIAVHETDPSRFPNPWRGLWFAIVTVTTVGYGDTFPTSPGGRVVASFLMIVGIGFRRVHERLDRIEAQNSPG